MKSRLALTLALSAATWTATGAQAQKERCGTRQPSLEEIDLQFHGLHAGLVYVHVH